MSNLFGPLFGFNSAQRPQGVKGAGTSATDVKNGEGIGFQSLLQSFSSRVISKLGEIKNNRMIDVRPDAPGREKEEPDRARNGKISDSSDHRLFDGRKNKKNFQLNINGKSPFHIPLSDGGWMELNDKDDNHLIQIPFPIEGEGKHIIEGYRNLPEPFLKMTEGKAFRWTEGDVKGAVVDFSRIVDEGGREQDSEVPRMPGPEVVNDKQQDQERIESHGVKTKKTYSISGNKKIPTKTILENVTVGRSLNRSGKSDDSLPSVKASQKTMFQRARGLIVPDPGVTQSEKETNRVASVKGPRKSIPGYPEKLDIKELKSKFSVEDLRTGRESMSSKVGVKEFQTAPKHTAVSNPVLKNQAEIARPENVGMAENPEKTGFTGAQRGSAPQFIRMVDGEGHPFQSKILQSNDRMDDDSASKLNLAQGKRGSLFIKMGVQRGTTQEEDLQDRFSKVSRSNPVSVPIKGEVSKEGLRVGKESIPTEVGIKGFQTVPKHTVVSNPVLENQAELAQNENAGMAGKSERTGLKGTQRGSVREYIQKVDEERHPFQGKILQHHNKMEDDTGSKSNLTEGKGNRQVSKMSVQRGTMQGEGFQDRLSMVSRSNPVSVPLKGDMSNSTPLRDSIMDQIASSMTNTIRAGRSRVTITLRPEEMGRLRMELISKNGIMEAKFFVESNEVKEMIEGSLSDLKTGLEKEGIRVENINVDVDREFLHLSGQDDRLMKKNNPYSRQDNGTEGDARFLHCEIHGFYSHVPGGCVFYSQD